MPTTRAPVPTAFDGSSVSIVLDGDPVNSDNLYNEASPGGTKKLTLGLLFDWIARLAKQANPASSALSAMPQYDAAGGSWIFVAQASDFYFENETGAAHIAYPLFFPDGAVVTSVSFAIQGATGHSAFPGGAPANMPNFQILKKTKLGVSTSIGTATDASSSVATYEVAHLIALTGAPLFTVDLTTYSYWLYFQPEHGTNAIAGSGTGTKAYAPSAIWT